MIKANKEIVEWQRMHEHAPFVIRFVGYAVAAFIELFIWIHFIKYFF